ncbi:hypothetical protein SynPROSU1_02700 [Synechococcus sp. PROS-U-1]|nr:hypothetical protein SynPROSU1_02700 [Synechococcus sp. PROS-U-1]
MPVPGTATTNVEMTCLQGLADLERLEGPWLDGLATGDPEVAATTVRLLLAHMTWNSKRLLGAMVLATSSLVIRNHSFRVADRGQSTRPQGLTLQSRCSRGYLPLHLNNRLCRIK